jgi:hypothetical protein
MIITNTPMVNDPMMIQRKLDDRGVRVNVTASVDGTTPDGDVTDRMTVNEVVSESWTVRSTVTDVTVVGASGGGALGFPDLTGLT